MKIKEITAIIVSASMLSACANTQNQLNETGANYGTEILCGVGAIGGAIVGNIIGRKLGNAAAGTAIGVALGAGGGCYAGNIWQKRSQALLDAAKKANIHMTTESALTQISSSDKQASGIVAQVNDHGMFDSGSAQLTNTGRYQMESLAKVYAGSDNKQNYFLVVGHTDSTGNPELNKQLSEQRAKAVGLLLRNAGISANHIYYQGAGSSRPIGNNQTYDGRAENRRVEISQLSDEKAMELRIAQEQANSRYLSYSSTTAPMRDGTALYSQERHKTARASLSSASSAIRQTKIKQPTANLSLTATSADKKGKVEDTMPAPRERHAVSSASYIDFSGQPAVSTASVVSSVNLRESSSWFPEAHAADGNMMSCASDSIRISGQVKSLATGKDFSEHHSYDYLPGYGGISWANVVNSNLVVISPVSILRAGAQVTQDPTVSIITQFTGVKKTPSVVIPAVAQTYQGKDEIIYRVYPRQPGSAVTCMDIVFSTTGAKATKGQIFYPKSNTTYVANYIPTP
ncbi:OmpA family protein [Tatumella saanichensis]|uniref:OmpA family protein n=1 Tax=Tatumella saanichensis TaxID=480813 RepID=UPI0004A4ADB9|nr:OmpA family protein [Tatumella saanichensis]